MIFPFPVQLEVTFNSQYLSCALTMYHSLHMYHGLVIKYSVTCLSILGRSVKLVMKKECAQNMLLCVKSILCDVFYFVFIFLFSSFCFYFYLSPKTHPTSVIMH